LKLIIEEIYFREKAFRLLMNDIIKYY